MNVFINDIFKNYIITFIRSKILTKLNENEFNMIAKMLIDLIEYISIRFNFNPQKYFEYEQQLKQNNNKDLIAIFNLLLPYIDDKDGSYILHKQISYLSDISLKKNDIKVINKNPYTITNLQFGLANITDEHINSNYISSNAINEYHYSINDIAANFHLLLGTIDQISNKLYVNWLNIRPIHPIKYNETRLYNSSYNYIFNTIDKKHIWQPKLNTFKLHDQINRYNGLSIGDYYNVIHHNLYFAIKDYKWLIYEYKKNTLYDMYINIVFDNFVNIKDYLLTNIDYIQIDEKIKESWYDAKNILINNINNDTSKQLCYNILYYLQRKYSDRYMMKNYIELKMPNDEDDDLMFLDLIQFTNDTSKIPQNDNIIKSWNSLTMEDLYNYLLETINKFRKTWYGYQIFELNHDKPKFGNSYFKIYNKNIYYKLSFKDIYNFAKSILITIFSNNLPLNKKSQTNSDLFTEDTIKKLMKFKNYRWCDLSSHDNDDYEDDDYEDDDYEDDDYSMFSDNNIPILFGQKRKFLMILNNYDKMKGWFNISKILTMKEMDSDENMHNSIIETIFKKLRDIVFESLTIEGLLSEFVIDKKSTDKITYSEETIRNNIKTSIFNKDSIEYYNDCIYYLTKDKYKNLPSLITETQIISYFDLLKDDRWYTFYAMDWISQINFFHRYINNRIIMITGATGAGKSTQIPKLLLYGLKMINFNNSGKVVSTQPRISPTILNAEQISKEMGVAIRSYSKIYNKKISNFLGYIQYKTANDAHQYNTDYYFKEMTDGTLVEELYNNPLLKKHNAEKDEKSKYNFDYGITNKYDIVVIDESHEHNKNMDIILTLMKYALYWNNSLKLVIISATMDDDEPIYRRFYKSIYDDNMFPFNLHNHSTFEHIAYMPQDGLIKYNIDKKKVVNKSINSISRFQIDRRIHISPPGETTQHKIIDKYLSIDTKNYDEAEQKGIECVQNIINNPSMNGDILFFTHGQKSIENIVTILNKNTPDNIIALPFYGQLSKEWQTYAEQTQLIHDFTIHKNDILNEIKITGSGTRVPKNTYNRVIVVATNVAEASITISKLKHVIDTGYYNSVIFDTINNKSIQEIKQITEASRKQRRGRVGRVSSGWVWYMYAFGSRENIFPTYNICTNDIRPDILKLMRNDNKEELLIDNNYNILNIINNNQIKLRGIFPNTEYTNLYLNIYDPSNEFKQLINTKFVITFKKNIHDIIYYHHTITPLDDNKYYLFYNKYNNINNYNDIHTRYESGYDTTSIFDLLGTFYIIHPGELTISRNMQTGIIELNNINNKYKINNFFSKTISPIKSLYYSRSIISYHNLNNNYKNTMELLSNTNKIINNIQYVKFPYATCRYKNFYNNIDTKNTYDIFFKSDFNKYYTKISNIIEFDKIQGIEQIDATIKTGCNIAIIYSMLFNQNIYNYILNKNINNTNFNLNTINHTISTAICGIISVIFAFGTKISDLLQTYEIDGQIKKDYKNTLFHNIISPFGDLITYYNLFNMFYTDFENVFFNDINNNINNTITIYDYNDYKKSYLNIKLNIQSLLNNKQNPWNNINMNYNDFIYFQKIDQDGLLDKDRGIEKYNDLKNTKIVQTNVNDEYGKTLIKWALIKKLSYKKLINMTKYYKIIIKKYIKCIQDKYIDWFFTNIPIFNGKTLNDNIIKCFLYGFSNNIKIYNKINNMPIYIDLYERNNYTNTTIEESKKLTNMPYHDYILYIAYDNNNSEPTLINKIELLWLIEYIPDIINNIYMKHDTTYFKLFNDINNIPIKQIINKYKETTKNTNIYYIFENL